MYPEPMTNIRVSGCQGGALRREFQLRAHNYGFSGQSRAQHCRPRGGGPPAEARTGKGPRMLSESQSWSCPTSHLLRAGGCVGLSKDSALSVWQGGAEGSLSGV